VTDDLRPSRRQALGAIGLGVGAAAAWTAPTILSIDAASAATTPPGFTPVLLAGAGGAFSAYDAQGRVQRSADGGQTWQVGNGGLPLPFVPTVVAGNGTVLAHASGTTDYLLSDDGGDTWSVPFVPPSIDADQLGQEPWVVHGATGVEFSGDANVYAPPTIPPTAIGSALLSGAGGDFALIGTVAGSTAAARSNDTGQTWVDATIDGALPPVALLAAGNSTALAYFPGIGTYFSVDGGASYAPSSGGGPTGPAFLTGSGSNYLAITAAGAVTRFTDGGDVGTVVTPVPFAPLAVTGQGSATFVAIGPGGQVAWTDDIADTWNSTTFA
jgi:hypothetical protein